MCPGLTRDKTTVGVFLTEWLGGRRDVRPNTLAGYHYDLKSAIDHLGAIPPQQLRTADIDALITNLVAELMTPQVFDDLPGSEQGSEPQTSLYQAFSWWARRVSKPLVL